MPTIDDLYEQSAANTAFNAAQAELNRDWQEYMSSTSHQREVGDLIAAGLNPVLSANSGSTWSSVGNAAADPTSAQGIMSLLGGYISADATKAAAGAAAAATQAAAAMNSGATIAASENNLLGQAIKDPESYLLYKYERGETEQLANSAANVTRNLGEMAENAALLRSYSYW